MSYLSSIQHSDRQRSGTSPRSGGSAQFPNVFHFSSILFQVKKRIAWVLLRIGTAKRVSDFYYVIRLTPFTHFY
jgi:hypothetical protein